MSQDVISGGSSERPADWVNPLREILDRRLPRLAGPCSLVIFGVTGDLARKKLMPAIYDLANQGFLPPNFALVGFGRRDWSDEQFGDLVKTAAQERSRTTFNEQTWEGLAQGIHFVQGTFEDHASFDRLASVLAKIDEDRGVEGGIAFYLSIPPDDFPTVTSELKRSGLSEEDGKQWRRLVIEKPFGHNLESAQELNKIVNSVFPEKSVFRIDHYLGKETVQNILAVRFANEMFEPLWSSKYIDHIQITMAENIGVEGRAGYYQEIGAARDVIQNHLLQLLALISMEEPQSFRAHDLQAEKIKVLARTHVLEGFEKTTARGQYTAGWQGSEPVIGLLEEEGFSPEATTETYAAITVGVDSPRWSDVPFFLRTGKRLGRRVTEIALIFKPAPRHPFATSMSKELSQNALVLRIQPDEGMTIRFGSKVPGTRTEIRDVNMDFAYSEAFTQASPEAYERLILDVLLGELSLFPVAEEVELSWKILDPVIEQWAEEGFPEGYKAGTWGPQSADDMIKRFGATWRRP